MKTIKFNNKVVVVPAETIVEYLEYRKINKELEKGYSERLKERHNKRVLGLLLIRNAGTQIQNTFTNLFETVFYFFDFHFYYPLFFNNSIKILNFSSIDFWISV